LAAVAMAAAVHGSVAGAMVVAVSVDSMVLVAVDC